MKIMYIVLASMLTVGIIGASLSFKKEEVEKAQVEHLFLDSLSVSSSLEATIRKAAKEANCSGDYLMQIGKKESNLNPHAKNKRSTALGLYQFTTSTWRDLMTRYPGKGLTKEGRIDPYVSSKGACIYTNDAKKRMKRVLGREITNQEAYIAHFAGIAGALKLLRASDSALTANVLGNHVIRANPFLRGTNVGQAKRLLTKGISN